MKRLRPSLFFLLLIGLTSMGLTSMGMAQTPQTVTGTELSQAGVGCAGGLSGTNCFVRFRLRNYAGTAPRVVGSGVVVPLQLDVIPNSSGVYLTPLYTNDLIQPLNCGVSANQPCTFYTVEFWAGGKEISSANWQFIGAGPFNLNTLPPLASALPPPAPFLPVLLNPVQPQRIANFGLEVPSLITDSYVDFPVTSPGNPASGFCRLFFNGTTLAANNFSGVSCGFAGGSPPLLTFQTTPPVQSVVAFSPDPTGTCDYTSGFYTPGTVQLCDPGNGTLDVNAGTGNYQVFTVRPPINGAISNGTVPCYVQAYGDSEYGAQCVFPNGTVTKSQNSIQFADQFPGVDAGAKINAAAAALPSTGGIIDARGFGSTQQTISTQITGLSSSTKIVTLLLSPETSFNVTVTGGVCAIPIGDGSGITTLSAANLFTVSVPLSQKSVFILGSAANVSAVVCAANPNAQQVMYLNGVSVWGNATATVGTALLDLQGLAAGTAITNVSTGNCYATAVEIRPSAANNITGDLLFENDNFACSGTTGSTNMVIDSISNSKLVANINFVHVQFQNQGPANSLFTSNGHGGSGGGVGIFGLHFYGCDFEVSSSTADAIVLTDTRDVTFDHLDVSGTVGAASNLLRLAETVNGITYNIEVKHLAGYASGVGSFPNLLQDVAGVNYNGTTVSGVKSIERFCFRCFGQTVSVAAVLTGTGACATFSNQVGGGLVGSAKCTGTTGAATLTIAPGPTATNGWVCSVFDETTRANLIQQTGHSTTSCTLSATSVTNGDVFVFTADPF